MQINSHIFHEAKEAARIPRFQYLMLGVIGAAIVPTMYMRRYSKPYVDRNLFGDVNNIQEQKEYIKSNPNLVSKNQDVKMEKELDKDMLQMHQPAVWRINGNNKITNDAKYRKLVDDNAMVLFSSIL